MDNNKHNGLGRDVEIDLRDDIAQGSYANLVIISHSPTEFVLDFASMLPGMGKPRVSNRILVTPEHAKRLLISLQDNITRYESNYGKIESPQQQQAQQQQDILSSLTNNKIGEA